MLCLLLLPLFLPFLLLRILIKTTVALVMLPFVLLIAGIGLAFAAFAVSLAVLIPLAPFAFVALFIWAVVRATSRPVVHRSLAVGLRLGDACAVQDASRLPNRTCPDSASIAQGHCPVDGLDVTQSSPAANASQD